MAKIVALNLSPWIKPQHYHWENYSLLTSCNPYKVNQQLFISSCSSEKPKEIFLLMADRMTATFFNNNLPLTCQTPAGNPPMSIIINGPCAILNTESALGRSACAVNVPSKINVIRWNLRVHFTWCHLPSDTNSLITAALDPETQRI